MRPRIRVLDGEWSFTSDALSPPGISEPPHDAATIRVPYAPGTKLSGAAAQHGARELRYYRTFELTPFECAGSVILNFLNIDGFYEIYLNGNPVGAGRGAYASAHYDVTNLSITGSNLLCVVSRPAGDGATRGIFGSVWLEFAARNYFGFLRSTAVYADKAVYVQGSVQGGSEGLKIKAEMAFRGKEIASYDYKASDNFTLCIPLKAAPEPWQIGAPALYDIRLTLFNAKGGICDTVYTYSAFREVRLYENKLYVNGKKTFLRAVRDNCEYYGAGNTAPSSAAIAQDYATAMTLGYNAVDFGGIYPTPKHLYILDKLGIAARTELIGSGNSHPSSDAAQAAADENARLISRDFGHPSILFRIPFTDFNGSPQLQTTVYENYSKLDSTRIMPATSGGKIYCSPLYEFRLPSPDTESLKALLYIRTNGGIRTEKEEARMLKADGALLTSDALRKLPAYVGAFSAGRLKKNDYLSEKNFIDNYAAIYDLIAASGAVGFTFFSLTDSGDGEGLMDTERNFLLSRTGISKLVAVNKRKALAES